MSTKVSRTVTINAPVADVWKTFVDFGNVADAVPSVKTSQLTSDLETGLGATRECHLAPMGVVQERITGWDEGKTLEVDIYESKGVPALRSGLATIDLDDLGNKTQVTVTMDYTVGLGAIGKGMNAMVMKRQFGASLKGLLAGYKHRIETGEIVTGKTSIPLDAVAVA
jgi:carbon monoxide dehydrogenase subunit G